MKLPEEVESGNIEYKVKIDPDNKIRLNELISQLKWRVNEGNGYAYYYIGVADDGDIEGISKANYGITMKNLSKMTKEIDCKITDVEKKEYKKKIWYKIKIEKLENDYDNYKIIFIGPQILVKQH